MDRSGDRLPELQWSHVFSDMVRVLGAADHLVDDRRASMEPCLFRHGKSIWAKETAAPVGLQWSHVFSDMVSPIKTLSLRAVKVLQWSHVFSDMVSGERIVEDEDEALASMEPCLFRHGKRRRDRPAPCPGDGFNGAMSFQTW